MLKSFLTNTNEICVAILILKFRWQIGNWIVAAHGGPMEPTGKGGREVEEDWCDRQRSNQIGVTYLLKNGLNAVLSGCEFGVIFFCIV